MAARYDIEAEKGSSFIFYVKYMDDDDSAVDLVGGGYTAEMQVRRFADSTTKLLQFKSTNGGVALGLGPFGVTAGNSGVIADPSTMDNVPVGDHQYDLEIIQGNTIVRLVEGTFVCKSNITG